MIEDAPAVFAERRSAALPAHVLERMRFEPEQLGGFLRGEQRQSSERGHPGYSRLCWNCREGWWQRVCLGSVV